MPVKPEHNDCDRDTNCVRMAQRLMDEAVANIGNALAFAAEATSADTRYLSSLQEMQRAYELAGVARQDIYNC